MKVTQITASSSTGFNHPYEQFANFKPHVSLTAELEDGDNVQQKSRELQSIAEKLVQDQKQLILNQLEWSRKLERIADEMEAINDRRDRSEGEQERLTELKQLKENIEEKLFYQNPTNQAGPALFESESGSEPF